jgi:hypothetical protein
MPNSSEYVPLKILTWNKPTGLGGGFGHFYAYAPMKSAGTAP